MKLYQKIASCLNNISSSERAGNFEMCDGYEATAERLTKEYMPSGAGIDSGTSNGPNTAWGYGV